MSIPASQIVKVNPRLLTPGGTDLEFNGLFITNSDKIPTTQLVLPFPDPESVGEYFGFESQEYKAAQIYFLGYNNSFHKPRVIYFARRLSTETKAYIRGANFPTIASETLEEIKKIIGGKFMIEMDGYTGMIDMIDFSAATSLSEVAFMLQTLIRDQTAGGPAWTNATVYYDPLFDAFVIMSGVAGAGHDIDFPDGDVAEVLLLREYNGAVKSLGTDGMSIPVNMDAILDLTTNFVCFTTIAQLEQDEVLEYARWANGKGLAYLFVYWDNDPNLLLPDATGTIAAALKEANLSSVCGVYDSLDYAAMILGTAASIDWNRRNGTITFAFKNQDGLGANVMRGVDAQNLEANNMNFMGDYATRNDNFIFMYPGRMFGTWVWIDTYLNAVWLANSLQLAIMTGLVQSPRVPYNSDGYALVRSWCQDPINRALYNGVIDTGVNLSESQKAELHREAGRDIATELFTDGYVLEIKDPAAAIRWRRESPECNLWFTYAGSIHRIELAATAVV